MKAKIAAEIIQQAIESPVQTWLDYTPKGTPIVVYDDDEFVFINHPTPTIERPAQLSAATAIEINGILTATIPSSMCHDEKSLLPLAYHECFHVYQGNTFRFIGEYDFFEVLAFYPELNYIYRALCSAETEVVNNAHLSALERAQYLSGLAKKRYEILSQHKGLLDFEKNLERNEGVASFVEQMARSKLYRLPLDNLVCSYGYSRQYFMGPAICWLLEQLYPTSQWQDSVQQGISLTEFLMQSTQHQKVNLEGLNLPSKEHEEQKAAEIALVNANQKIDDLLDGKTFRIKLPDKTQVSRSFSPRSIISLGDGRLIHPEFVIIQIPNGRIAIQGDITLEDYNHGIVICRAVPYQIQDGKLEINTSTVQIQLSNVKRTQDHDIEVLGALRAG